MEGQVYSDNVMKLGVFMDLMKDIFKKPHANKTLCSKYNQKKGIVGEKSMCLSSCLQQHEFSCG